MDQRPQLIHWLNESLFVARIEARGRGWASALPFALFFAALVVLTYRQPWLVLVICLAGATVALLRLATLRCFASRHRPQSQPLRATGRAFTSSQSDRTH